MAELALPKRRIRGAAAALLPLMLQLAGCAPAPAPAVPQPALVADPCRAGVWAAAARANAGTLEGLAWAPFGRDETGWATYAPLVQHEIGAVCPPDSEGFAAALAAWQAERQLPPSGLLGEADFLRLKSELQGRRPFVALSAAGVCPETADEIAAARTEEGFLGKQVWLRPGALGAYRRMLAAARVEDPQIAEDLRNLSIFSGYRSPSSDAARCQAEGDCDGVARARCSPHRTGLALDLYVGQAPGFAPDSSADENRRFMVGTPTYRWLLANAHRFGFVNYPFEPWHWEWTGEPP